ncbi:unnamed protein product [Rotaria magnacalcarata]|uniref:TIR domain-containing protein n=3 Tax=Rotaria magnacalcarata TaxID=392030 RepID=A0A816N0R6_9BILA|nr:unnamed protein product [Rotaria magnacalcarata]
MRYEPNFFAYNTQPPGSHAYTHYPIQTLISEHGPIDTESLHSKFVNSHVPKSYKLEIEYLSNHSACNLNLKSNQDTDYVNITNQRIKELNRISSATLADIATNEFCVSIRNLIRNLLLDWHSSCKLSRDETNLLSNSIFLFNHLINSIQDVTKLSSWLPGRSLINTLATCMSDIDRLLSCDENKQNFKQLTCLFDILKTYYQRLPSKLQYGNVFNRLFEATIDCLLSLNFDRTFRNLKPYTQSMTTKQNFFLIQCSSFFINYHGIETSKTIEQFLDTMVPRYAAVLDKHIESIKEWNSPMIHIVHHLLLTVAHAKNYYAPYANGQPLRWLIDIIVRIISEPALVKKVDYKARKFETILINAAVYTLTAFVHEPDLLVYIKKLKIISIVRSLILLSYEPIVIHACVILAYTLDEEDIKASEKESGRLLSNLLNLLRKNMRALTKKSKNEEAIESNITLLVEALQSLVQHDQIKVEILKQNALYLLIDNYQTFNDRSKRLVLESLVSVTFIEGAARLLGENKNFINSIQNMQKTATEGIQKAAEKILWNLHKESENSVQQTKKMNNVKMSSTDRSRKHQYDIMISYCHAEKELVNRIHQFLVDQGFKIWIDQYNIYGAATQAMIDAVENSEFIIICMSDSYKRSAYCQAEAEYAFRCKRRLLPVILRQGYRPDGWLGLLLGSRIYIDFTQLEFFQACTSLLKEIQLQRGNHCEDDAISGDALNEDQSNAIKRIKSDSKKSLKSYAIETLKKAKLPEEYLNRNTVQSIYRSISAHRWTTDDILDFLYDTNLHYMMPLCEFMTGRGLMKLCEMCQAAPNRFYSQLNKEFISRFNGIRLPIGIFIQFLSEIDRFTDSSSISPTQNTKKYVTQLKSVLTSEPSTSQIPVIAESNSNESSSTSVLEPFVKPIVHHSYLLSPEQTRSPTLTTFHTSRKVHITEQASFQTETIVAPTNNCIIQTSI